ncbi:hypothetical protein TBK1r_50020 [Stieleria magnilauensis]|uniref:Uncharacterized protein n=1 Tax=Stieleria magnilauensis TaxID=2527963 RepID=A0ABX5XX14_9BACT|nr:hypothetical protein TBK1r_50020 [Planctomycetes bacterium TBK1r]
MKPGGLAQCLPVVSSTGIQCNEAQRTEGPAQLFSWPPGPEYSIGPPGLERCMESIPGG